MTTRKSKEKAGKKREADVLKLTDLDVLPEHAVRETLPVRRYNYCYTTGPFLLPPNPGSLDWVVLNNDTTQQMARITVFRCASGTIKTPVPSFSIVVTLDPGETTHNANTYPAGHAYEVQVECNSRLVLPYVSVWPANFGEIIPGTGINSGMFLRQMP